MCNNNNGREHHEFWRKGWGGVEWERGSGGSDGIEALLYDVPRK